MAAALLLLSVCGTLADESDSETGWPPVAGPEPSSRVAAFYYPWYRTPDVDGYWDHWGDGEFNPPLDIPSDYYPALGVYSAADPLIVAQHCAWLREAGVGVVVSSWWGQRSRGDLAVPLLLDIAEHYGIQVAFHIEPYEGRAASGFVEDVQYIYEQYGDHKAFFRSTASSRWSPDDRPKGLFFLFAPARPAAAATGGDRPVDAGYWSEALDAVHALPGGCLVLAAAVPGSWIDGGHFDGIYNYVTIDLDWAGGFRWAQSLPPGAWYVPSVMPGNSPRRIGYPEEDYVPRQGGATYDEQWEAALGVGVEPALVTITSFNEWHEGTQIEPAAVGATNGRGYTYDDYGPLPPEGYLALTEQWITRFLQTTWPASTALRIWIETTSDWTTFNLISGADWLRPSLVSASVKATYATMDADHFLLRQPIERANAGRRVGMTIDVLFSGWDVGGTLVFEIERGGLGWTRVQLSKLVDGEYVVAETLSWSGNRTGRNALTARISADDLFESPP